MPLRDMNREQMWLLPPTLDELLPLDHPARFVAEFVDALGHENWKELGVEIEGDLLGAPSYHPRALLSVWLFGFMTGIRSSRKLEAACRDQIPYLWLTGWQHPDHNTLWRFYKGHRQSMRNLLRRTVRTALAMDLVDLAVQAVDGTKVPANASSGRSYDAEGLARLLQRLERAIAELEDQNEGETDGAPVHLPEGLANKRNLRDQVRLAMEELEEQKGRNSINLTDRDARFMKMRHGFLPAYNAQAMVSPVTTGRETSGMLVTAIELVDEGTDNSSLIPMLQGAEEMTGLKAPLTLADAGYHSAAALQECADRGQQMVMPESPRGKAQDHPYHKDRFAYDADSDTYRCPQGQVLRFVSGQYASITTTGSRAASGKLRSARTVATVVRCTFTKGIDQRQASHPKCVVVILEERARECTKPVCQACPVVAACITNGSRRRSLVIGPYDTALRRHRAWMATNEAHSALKMRKQLVEPVFGIVKEQLGVRRLLLRGIDNVAVEWTLLATAFNLRTLWRIWRSRSRVHPCPQWKTVLSP